MRRVMPAWRPASAAGFASRRALMSMPYWREMPYRVSFGWTVWVRCVWAAAGASPRAAASSSKKTSRNVLTCRLFPLNGRRGLRTDVIDDAVDATDFVDDLIRNAA